ncbi:MAG: hypothetical protein GX561_03095 [Lentisphaerae bacterium]|jgi:hypothetical protein|nr:hypothetical protein [Lentisphaerota bacterium]
MRSALPILLLSSIVAFPKTAAIFDHDGRPSQNLTKAIEQAGYDVKPAAPKDLDAINQFDLLVIPNPQRFPAEKFPVIAQILSAKKDILFLGPRPFTEPTHAIGDEWLSIVQLQDKLAATKQTTIQLPPAENWIKARKNRDVKASWTVENQTLTYELDYMDGWHTYQTDIAFPPEQNIVRFAIRGNPATSCISIECIESDGSRWIATIKATTDWKEVALTPRDFAFWRDCKPTKPRGHAGDQLNLHQTRSIAIGLSATHTPSLGKAPYYFQIRNFGTAFSPYANTLETPAIPPIETVYPSYKQYPIIGKPGFYHTPNRFCGRGIDQQPKWKWTPLFVKDGQLVQDYSLKSTTHIWLTLLLHDPFKLSRVATIAQPVQLEDEQYLETVTLVAKRLLQNVELIAGGADKYGLFNTQPLKIGAEIAFLDDAALKQAQNTTVKLTLGKQEFTLNPNPNGSIIQKLEQDVVGLEPDSTIEATAKLLVNGTQLDQNSHLVNVAPMPETLKARSKERISVQGDNFILDGKPWYPVGINLWFSSTAGYEPPDYLRCNLAPGIYDPEQAELDLTTLESLGFNMVSLQLKCDNRKEETFHYLVDFFARCRNHNIYVNGFINQANPLEFNESEFIRIVRDSNLYLFPTLFAYDTSWEPGNYVFNERSRPRFDNQWRQWVNDRYGSIQNAVEDWGIKPNLDKQGQLTSPTSEQLTKDGNWRIYTAAYRRFMDDVTSEMWNSAVRKIRQISPLQLVSFRQGNTLPHDFALTGPIKHLDFICPEGYSFQSIDNVTYAAGFITRFIDFVSRGKPIIWSEFGRSCWDAATQSTNRDSFDSVADYHEAYYKMVLESEANGTAPWWWSGGYRVNERSDYGISDPDGTPRPAANLLLEYASKLKLARTRTKGQIPFDYDRDKHAGGYWYMAFNDGKEAYKQAREQNKHLLFSTKATGTTSANVPLVAIGNTQCNGSTPPKYLNAELNLVQLKTKEGNWIELTNDVKIPEGANVTIRIQLGNLTEPTWIAPKNPQNPQEGDVILLKDDKPIAALTADTAHFDDAWFTEISLGQATGTTQTFQFKAAAYKRTAFGPTISVTINP